MNTVSDPGTFIVVDGIDGGGKTTLVRELAVFLGTNFVFSFPTRETPAGKIIRQVFADPVLCRPETLLYLFVADALDAQTDIRAALDAGHLVLCDRHTCLSAFAYQQTDDRPPSVINQIIQPPQFIRPDQCYLVDIPAEVAEARINARNKTTGEARNLIYEKALEEKRQRFLRLATRSTGFIKVLDGQRSTDDLVKEVGQEILAIHKKKAKP
jgi:dTMP kinase